MRRGTRKQSLSLMLVLSLVMALFVSGPVQAAPLPELLITEIVPASSGTGQPYEYVEIYNTTERPINLNGYKLQYFTASPYTKAANTWGITDKVIPARTALVLWLKKFDYPTVPLADFNANYGTNLTADQVFEVKLTTSAQGLHDSSKRRAGIARPDLTLVSAAYINDGVVDGVMNKSVTYKYGDALDMVKIANGQVATPGALVPEQMPGEPDDTVPPPVPAGVTAVAGYGTVTLTWAPVDAADLAGYRVYRDGALALSVSAGVTTATTAKLTGGTYNFTVSAIDQHGNESAQSAVVTATPAHELVTQEERGSATPDSKYETFRAISSMGPVVPGLVQGLVPQGIAWWPGQDWLVTSHYITDGRPSVLTMVDAHTGSLVKSLRLYQEDGAPYVGHAGGVAITGENLWIASGGFLYRIALQDLLAAPDNGNIAFAGRFPVETNASFVSYADGILWAGEFYHPPGNYNTDPSHHMTNSQGAEYGAWIAGYRIDPASDQPAGADPDYIYSIRDQIQGMAITADSVILSRSYGRKNDSYLFKYAHPDLNGAPHTSVTVEGKTVPVWFLDEAAYAENQPVQTLPPLAEGLVTDGAKTLYVLFESGANEYRFDGFNPLDRLGMVDLDAWTRYGSLRIDGLPQRLELGEQATLQVLQYLGNRPEADVTATAALAVA
ncbi:MAG TPA: lamin tail domain-containing protein, partial [Symbiobacteriaceae bacterium]|nr:lamin tail domain-containing protein [Symbiobacteriaceae bacterium]